MEIKGGEKLAAALNAIASKMDGGSVAVGFLGGETYPDGTPVAAVAFWNEFGTVNTPARPFFRTAIRENSGEWAAKIAKAAPALDYDSGALLNLIGAEIQQDIQASINNWESPENAASTVEKKGFNKPLIDTGQMQRAVDYEVKK